MRLFKLNEGDSESDLLQADKERLIPALSKTTYSDVFAEWGDELNVVEDEENIERPGMDFIVANDVGDYKLCRDYCRNEQPKCITWSWDTRTKKCLMKNGIPGRKQLNSTSGVRSGVFGYKYVCKRQLTNK